MPLVKDPHNQQHREICYHYFTYFGNDGVGMLDEMIKKGIMLPLHLLERPKLYTTRVREDVVERVADASLL